MNMLKKYKLTITNTLLQWISKTFITFVHKHMKYLFERWHVARNLFELSLNKVFIFIPF